MRHHPAFTERSALHRRGQFLQSLKAVEICELRVAMFEFFRVLRFPTYFVVGILSRLIADHQPAFERAGIQTMFPISVAEVERVMVTLT